MAVPGTAGDNDMHLSYFDELLLPADVVDAVELSFVLPEQGVGPIVRNAERVGPGHYLYSGEAMAIGGTWEVTVITTFDDGDRASLVLAVPVAA